MKRSLVAIVWIPVLVVGACTVSPQPLPPPQESISIEISGLTMASNKTGGVTLIGAKGAVRVIGSSSARGLLDVVSLSGSPMASFLEVAEDGSFSGTLQVQLTDELRLQASIGDLRSPSLDITAEVDGDAVNVVAPPRVLSECLRLTPSVDIDAGVVDVGQSRAATLHVENACATDVTIANVEQRFSDPTWRLSNALPTTIVSNASRDLAFTFAPLDTTARREVFVLGIESAGGTGPRALTLRGRGRTPTAVDACSGLDEAKCVTMNACRAAYVGTCDCSCGTFKDGNGVTHDLGPCANCPATCFTFNGCVSP